MEGIFTKKTQMAFVQRNSFWIVLLACVWTCKGQTQTILNQGNVCQICDVTFESDETCAEKEGEMENIQCSNVDVTEINDWAFANETHLTVFKMENTALMDVGEKAFCETRIEKLLLRKNKLYKIPNTTCISTTLKILDLKGNSIRHINSSLGFLTLLKELDISNNGLEYAPYDFLCGTAMETIWLNDNRLTSTLNFSCFDTIFRIEMKENDIQTIAVDSFKNVFVQKQIVLENNRLDNVSVLSELAETNGQLNIIRNKLTCFNVVSVCLPHVYWFV